MNKLIDQQAKEMRQKEVGNRHRISLDSPRYREGTDEWYNFVPAPEEEE